MQEKPELPGSSPRARTLTTASSQITPANVNRRKLILVNDSTVDAYICRGASAVLNTGIRLNANGGALIDEPDIFGRMYYGPWAGIVSTGTAVITISEE